jgi:PPOX class probable F420-dependent enzyme
MWTVMDAAAREEFLAGVHVGVLSAAMGAPGRTLAVPVWYGYRPSGLVTVLTGRGSRKARAIRAAGRFSLCAQDERPPYRYVSVEGPVLSEDEPSAAERLALAHRYLGPADGDRYVADNPDPGRENVAFRMRPEHWLSQDQGTELAARLPARTARRACETGQPVTLLLRIADYELVTTVSLQLVDARITTGSGRPPIVLSGRRPGGLATGRAGECAG